MNYYKLHIAYDGTNYHGWQYQTKTKQTVAGTIKEAFEHTFNHPCSLVGASRTDAGVHAYGQVARLRTTFSLDENTLLLALNNALPNDIVIKNLSKIGDDFHPQKNVVQKKYWYHFFLQWPLPFYERFGYRVIHPADIEKLRMVLQLFVGTHDFRSFITFENQREAELKNTIRRIDDISLIHVPEYDAYRIVITGLSFMRHMIRRMVGAALEVASRSTMDLGVLKDALKQKNSYQPFFPTAPAQGLTLHSITYQND